MIRIAVSRRATMTLGLLLGVVPFILCQKVRAAEPSENVATLPYTISLKEPFTIEGMPGLHSFCHAHADVDGRKWVFMTGRMNGLHGFLGYFDSEKNLEDNFPSDQAASRIWVVDIAKRKTWSCGLDGLPVSINEQLRSTNAQHVQVDHTLYIVGGYGYSASATTNGKMVTFDKLIAVDVPGLVKAIMQSAPIDPYFRQTSHLALKVTGGNLARLGDSLCLVFGNSFDGLYSPNPNAPGTAFQQQYTEQVRVFGVEDNPLSIVGLKCYPGKPSSDPRRPYHRRDGNVGPAIAPDGKPRIGVYGGVFVPGQFEAYFEPIYIDEFKDDKFSPGIDSSFQQTLNHYECPLLPIFDSRTADMYTTFFGGMSSFWYDYGSGQLIKDSIGIVGGEFIDGVPFIKSISTVLHRRNGTSCNYVLPITMPGYLGSAGHLLVDPGVPQHANGVIRLEALNGPTTVGHIFGSIESGKPYGSGRGGKGTSPTWASNKFIEVVVIPGECAVKAVPLPKTKSDLSSQGARPTPANGTQRYGEKP